ncbi:GNAT family N-acetyltransferase [Acinetobacter stercoris]|uniref:Acetyltransferase (GNAT) family protein n=1 Tax=Acinetobacter stercoris TaxID=2126983 RepID=A0A2U3N3I0_9GAMM|nr:GNAT family N-acetyltransferase [Acinetobacter stercoris]SPL72165.1 Acetyltransferase (GNAT) family protein [Acinetobacter stercoris]
MVIENKEMNSGEIIACLGLSFDEDKVEIGTFCIEPSRQNKGLGKKLLSTAEKFVQVYNSNGLCCTKI